MLSEPGRDDQRQDQGEQGAERDIRPEVRPGYIEFLQESEQIV